MKVACLQMNSNRDIAHNIVRLEALVKEAVGQGAQLVATPENTFVMGEPLPGEERRLYTMQDHPGVAAGARIARDYGCWLLIGSLAVQEPGLDSQKSFNRSLLFNPAGEIAAQYDKIHLFDVELGNGEVYAESSRMLPGGKAVVASLFPSPGRGEGRGGGLLGRPFSEALSPTLPPAGGGGSIRLGLSICYDLRFPQLYRALAKEGADMIAIPAAFTVPTGEAHWHVLLRARAIETGCFILAPAQTGEHPGGRRTYGHALIVDPWGKILADGGTQEGFIIAELDMAHVARTRQRLPSLQHDRAFVISPGKKT